MIDYDLLVKLTRNKFLEFYSADTCIATTRLLQIVLKEFDTPLTMVASCVVVLNEAIMLEFLTEELDPFTIDWDTFSECCQRFLNRNKKCYSIGIGFNHKGIEADSYPHHVIGFIQTPIGFYMADSSIDQVNREFKDIKINPFITKIDNPNIEYLRLDLNRCSLIYVFRYDELGFINTPSYTNLKRLVPLRDSIIKEYCAIKNIKQIGDCSDASK